MNAQPPSSWRDTAFLEAHIAATMAFYHPHCIDRERGGFYHDYRDDGTLGDRDTRHLVSSTRFVINYAWLAADHDDPAYREAAAHGFAFLRDVHRDPRTGAYAWLLGAGNRVLDDTSHAYGLAFVLLACARAHQAGVSGAAEGLAETWQLLERHYWEPAHALYLDERSGDLRTASDYRGQNANMHACEALIAAWEATGQRPYLERALTLARRVTVDLAAQGDGLIWEHYDRNWRADWDYNRDDPKHMFRPWGFQPGHQTEWAKLLATLARHCDADWLVPRAVELLEAALRLGWDDAHGGLVYCIDRDRRICDADKYYWVQAEAFAAAARVAELTGDARWWDEYDRLWAYSWAHLVDHEHGAWYRILDPANRKLEDHKSPPGKTDYHIIGACREVIGVLDRCPP